MTHPLDPLSADEFRRVTALLRAEAGVTDRWRIASIELREPSRGALDAGTPVPREATAVCWDRDSGNVHRARISLDADTVVAVDHCPDVQPNATVDEWYESQAMLRTEPAVVAALKKRGITDIPNVLFDLWTYGGDLIPQRYRGRRVGWTDVWYRDATGTNPYANPVNGLHLVVDLNAMELLEIEDVFTVGKPATMGEYVPRFVPGQRVRTDRKPLEITQPDGVSFTLDGHGLRWQNWSMRIGFNYREGLVIHQLAYDDDGRARPVAHRLSIAEMVVPYRDPTPDHYRRTAFDIGEWGLGFMTTSLTLGCDCLGAITYLDAVLHDSKGEPYEIPQAICVHEEDDGVLWKHVDAQSGAETRRRRRLVVSFHATVANYEYLVYWRFYEDGTIECEVRATGIMVTSHFPAGEAPPYGTVVDERTYAPFHQHFLIARLDMDVDGGGNTVHMTETEQVPVGPGNPYGLALVQRAEPLLTETAARQDVNWRTQRGWKVVNPGSLNRFGSPVAYKLAVKDAIPAMLDVDSPVFRRARALGHTVWVTRYDETQRWPCGEFCNQSSDDDGLPVWTAADRSIDNTDIVLWHVFGIHHITRVEDWPVMPVDAVSFQLKPFGFFDRNPALDVAPSPGHTADTGHCDA